MRTRSVLIVLFEDVQSLDVTGPPVCTGAFQLAEAGLLDGRPVHPYRLIANGR